MDNTQDARSLAEYLNSLKSGAPTPGGGSASAYTGAMGTALFAMVCRLTLRSIDSSDLEDAANNLDTLVDSFSRAARSDEECFGRYRAATDLPKSTEHEKSARSRELQSALRLAALAPLNTLELVRDAFAAGQIVASLGTKHALSDLTTGRHLLLASARGAEENVAVNLAMIKDATVARDLAGTMTSLLEQIDRSADALLIAVRSRS